MAVLWLEGKRGGDGSLVGPRRECELSGLKGTTPDVILFWFCYLKLSSRICYIPVLPFLLTCFS